MAWLRIDDRFRTHPKIQRARLAGWLAFCGICYCREHLTDGLIPREAVQTLAPGLPTPYKHAAKLVEVGLWHEETGGYRVHDFLDWNPSRESVMSLRDKERDKKRTQRGQSGDTHARIRAGAGDAGLGSPSGLGDLGSEPSEESARETTGLAPVWTQRRSGAFARADTLVQNHTKCVPCAAEACGRGVCVPGFLVGQWLAQKGYGAEAQAYVRAFLSRVLSRIAEGQAVGDGGLDFWKAEWLAEHGSQARKPAPMSRGAQNVAAVTRALEKRLARQENQS